MRRPGAANRLSLRSSPARDSPRPLPSPRSNRLRYSDPRSPPRASPYRRRQACLHRPPRPNPRCRPRRLRLRRRPPPALPRAAVRPRRDPGLRAAAATAWRMPPGRRASAPARRALPQLSPRSRAHQLQPGAAAGGGASPVSRSRAMRPSAVASGTSSASRARTIASPRTRASVNWPSYPERRPSHGRRALRPGRSPERRIRRALRHPRRQADMKPRIVIAHAECRRVGGSAGFGH